ncbi:Fur family transcriptional regulator [Aestuariibius insulae]|uniref:Fur family transcriptional regulator n=1 Tax=Aestuariibius insulae TaxID=2058287 RepID=UPI00345ED16C
MSQLSFVEHDHRNCIASGLTVAEHLCLKKDIWLTPIRRRVFEILLTEHRALGAYEILEQLTKDGLSAKPPTAYRALDFLTRHGLAHRVERLNAYIACPSPDKRHDPAFLICTDCDHVAETTVPPGVVGIAEGTGFDIKKTVIEATGLCPKCRTS